MVRVRRCGTGKTSEVTHVDLLCVICEGIWVLESKIQASGCLLRLAEDGTWYTRPYRSRTRLHIDVGGTVEDKTADELEIRGFVKYPRDTPIVWKAI